MKNKLINSLIASVITQDSIVKAEKNFSLSIKNLEENFDAQ
jgi:hypothetical protein